MKTMTRLFLATLALAACASPLPAREPAPLDWDADARLLMHAAWLANDARDGRGIGTEGLDASADYIERRFREAGLAPALPTGYRQPFQMLWGARPLAGSGIGVGTDTLTTGSGAMPFGFSGQGEASGDAVFAGYGITAAEYDWDDYDGLDVEGRIVVVLEGEPETGKDEERFAGRLETDHASPRTKAINARVHGAAGLVVIHFRDELVRPRLDQPYSDSGLPVLAATHTALSPLLPGFDAAAERARLNRTLEPASRGLDTALHLAARLERRQVPVANVVGVLPGDERVIILGAHYDHLGRGQAGSTEPEVGAVHNGADDNASGVAVLLELARLLGQDPPEATVWFVSFTGEEAGVVGSTHFVRNPPDSLDRARAMINLDMVGRVDTALTVHGVQSAEGLEEAAARAGEGTGLELALAGGGYGASDHTPFYAAGLPVVHLLGPLHTDYHSPRDDVSRLRGDGLVKVLDYAWRLVHELDRPETELRWVKATRRGGPPRGRGVPVSMGTIPDFTAPEGVEGFRITGVREGSPADRAGLQAMDVILSIGEVTVRDIHDFTFALRRHRPGERATVVYHRDGVQHRTEVVFAEPAARRGGKHPGASPGEGKGHPGGGQGHPGGGQGHPGGGQGHPGGSPAP